MSRYREIVPYERIFVIVTDFLGIGSTAEAAEAVASGTAYGSRVPGADTLEHLAEAAGRLKIPTLRSLGLANIKRLPGVDPITIPLGRCGILKQKSRETGILTGHLEMMGLPNGAGAEQGAGGKEKYAGESMPVRTALNVLADAGLTVVSVGRTREMFGGSGITRVMEPEEAVGCMEPGQAGEVVRCMEPGQAGEAARCMEQGQAGDAAQCMELAGAAAELDFRGLCLVSLAGLQVPEEKRRDAGACAEALERFDRQLHAFMQKLKKRDLMVLTSVCGNDPEAVPAGPTRENVLFICWSPSNRNGMGGRIWGADSFGTIGATVLENFGLTMPEGCSGKSRLEFLH